MRNITAIEILSTFSRKERKEFHIFIKSVLFVPRRKTAQLYEILLRDNPELSEDNINKEHIYKELFPDEWEAKGYNDATMRHSFYELQKSAEKYLVFKKVENSEALYDEILRKELRDRHLDKLYVNKLDESEKKIEKNKKLGSEYFLNKYKIFLERINFNSMYEEFLLKKTKKLNTKSLDKAAYYLTYFFIVEFLYLEMGCEKISNRHDNSYSVSFIKNLYDLINVNKLFTMLDFFSNDKSERNLSRLYNKRINMFAKNKPEYFEVKRIILKQINILDQNLRYQLLFELPKYISDRRSDLTYLGKEEFHIYKYIVDKNYYSHSEGTYFAVDLYWNVLNVSINHNKLDWGEKFLDRFKADLPPIVQNSIYNWGMANISFSKKEFNKALMYLNDIDKDFFNLGIWSKVLRIKIFIETYDYEVARSYIQSMLKYLNKSKKFSNLLKDRYIKFLETALFIVSDKSKIQEYDLINHKDILCKYNVAYKTWLLEKIEELEKETNTTK